METVPVDYIGKDEVAYALIVLLSEQAKQQIGALQTELTRELPGVLWTAPPDALHITLCEIIQLKAYAESKEALWARHAEEYKAIPAGILRGLSPIAVHFDMVEASQNAVIVKGHDDGTFNTIRRQLFEQLPLPEATAPPPEIIHSSIARYSMNTDLADVQRVVQRHRISFTEQVGEIVLLKSTVAPLLKYETLARYKLA